MSLDYLRLLIREMAQTQTRHLGIQRKPRLQQLKELVKDPPTHAVRFTNIERANFNPRGEYEEGYGAYVFPLNKYFFEQLMEGQVYFSDYKFIHLFKMPPNVLDVTKSDKRITIKFVKDFMVSMNADPKIIIQVLNDYKEYTTEGSKNQAFYNALKVNGYTGAKESNALRKFGINGFYDPGESIIYDASIGEGSQAIITNPASLEFIETMKTDDVLRSEKIIKGFVDSSDEYRNQLLKKTEIGNAKSLDKLTYFTQSARPGDITYGTVIKMLDHVKKNIDKVDYDVPLSRFSQGPNIETGMDIYSAPKNDKDIASLLMRILVILEYKVRKTSDAETDSATQYVRNEFTEEQFENIFNRLSEIQILIEPKQKTYEKFKSNFEALKRFKKQKDREEITRNKYSKGKLTQ
jgi:hypothetical protein